MNVSIAFIGAGRLGQSLAVAFAARGLHVQTIASRDPSSARRLAGQIEGCRAATAEEAVESAGLVFLTVPDDHIGPVAGALPWRAGQRVVHCSGATEVAVLDHAARRGALTGGFHPLQTFADPQRAVNLLAGSTVAIEGGPELAAELRTIAGLLSMHVVQLPPGARALYHGGASFAASFLLSMLQEAAAVWQHFGIDEGAALKALLPLSRGILDAAANKGLAGALSGPISRGDDGVISRHLQALAALGAPHADLYREMSRRQLELARAGGRLNAAQLARMQALVRAEHVIVPAPPSSPPS